jgi:predicted alpha/beta superfamily hydrolase
MSLNRTIFFICFLLVFAKALTAQITNLKVDSISSKILAEKRILHIYLPSDLAENKPKQKKYPVLYVLDGEDTHFSVAGMINYLNEKNGNRVLPKMIVVFIHNTQRTRDLTPYPVHASAILPTEMAKQTGGGEKFTQSILQEIIPYIETKYPASGYRALAGHSFGGLFALSVLKNHPDMFDDYLVMDPSLWYDEGKFADALAKQLRQNQTKYAQKALFIAIANTVNEPTITAALRSKATFSTHEKEIIRFCQSLKKTKTNFPFEYKFYPKDDHGSVPLIGLYDGLRHFFQTHQMSYYDVINPRFDPENAIESYYQNLSQKLKTTIQVSPEELIYFDMFYQINEDKTGQNKLRAYFKKRYPAEFEIHTKK